MSDLFDEEEDEVVEGDVFLSAEEEVVFEVIEENGILDARRRLENMLEERRLREELEDFIDE